MSINVIHKDHETHYNFVNGRMEFVYSEYTA